MPNVTFYDVLEVAQTATEAEIRGAYRLIISMVHPDKFAEGSRQQQRAAEKTLRINEAYETLSDPRARAEYDDALRDRDRLAAAEVEQRLRDEIRAEQAEKERAELRRQEDLRRTEKGKSRSPYPDGRVDSERPLRHQELGRHPSAAATGATTQGAQTNQFDPGDFIAYVQHLQEEDLRRVVEADLRRSQEEETAITQPIVPNLHEQRSKKTNSGTDSRAAGCTLSAAPAFYAIIILVPALEGQRDLFPKVPGGFVALGAAAVLYSLPFVIRARSRKR